MSARVSLLSEPPLPRPDAAEGLAWLRRSIRLYARDLAVRRWFGKLAAEAAQDQLGLAADGFADQAGLPDPIVRAAVEAEALEAEAAVQACAEQLRRRMYFMAREQAPGVEMIASAEAICLRADVDVPPDLLLDRIVEIATDATKPRRRRHAA